MLNPSIHAHILLLTGLILNLSEIVTIISSLMQKNNIFPHWSLHHLTIIERVVKSQLTDHLFSHNLLNHRQSADRRHHSTATTLLYINDHLINAIGSQKLSCLCLLDLSTAFNTTMTFYSLGSHAGLAFMALFYLTSLPAFIP